MISSKTENGIRKVPITDKVLPFYKARFEDNPECEYLIHTPDGKHLQYRNYYDSYFHPLMEQLKIDRTPHCCRHTCISMLTEVGVDQTIIKKIVRHSGAMTSVTLVKSGFSRFLRFRKTFSLFPAFLFKYRIILLCFFQHNNFIRYLKEQTTEITTHMLS